MAAAPKWRTILLASTASLDGVAPWPNASALIRPDSTVLIGDGPELLLLAPRAAKLPRVGAVATAR